MYLISSGLSRVLKLDLRRELVPTVEFQALSAIPGSHDWVVNLSFLRSESFSKSFALISSSCEESFFYQSCSLLSIRFLNISSSHLNIFSRPSRNSISPCRFLT